MTAYRPHQSRFGRRAVHSLALTGAIVWILGASEQAHAQSAIEGVWQGRYTCSQGPTGFTVEVKEGSKGRLRFYPLPENPAVPEGEYEIEIVQHSIVEIELRPVRWIKQPPGYSLVSMRGAAAPGTRRLRGLVEGSGCADFVLTKVESKDSAPGAVPNSIESVEPQTQDGADVATAAAGESAPPQTTNPRHGLISPEDFAAIGLNAGMSASDVFAHFSSDKKNDIYWRTSGIDANCQGVSELAVETILSGRTEESDRRAFKLVVHQRFDAVSLANGSQCSIRFVGEMMYSLGCRGRDRLGGKSSVMDEFVQSIGKPDHVAKNEFGSTAEWHCASDPAKRECKVTIEANEPPCIIAEAKTICPGYVVGFARDYRLEQEKVDKQLAILRKQGGCMPEADAGVPASGTAQELDPKSACTEKGQICLRECVPKLGAHKCLECIKSDTLRACVAVNGAQLCTSFGCW